MKKTGIAVGVLVAVGLLSTAGAWYTGTQLPAVLEGSIAEANQKGADALLGTGITSKLELLSLDSHLFTSTAHYRLTLDMPASEGEARHLEVLLVDNIQHGPLPAARLKKLNLWPVLATSNFALEPNQLTQKWFDAAKGASPLTGEVSLGYDHSTSGTLSLTPLDFAPAEGQNVKFSGLNLDLTASAHAEKVTLTGGMDSLVLNGTDSDGKAITFALRGLTLDSDQKLGSGDFYLGDSSVKLASAELTLADKPPVVLKNIAQTGTFEEAAGKLAGHVSYDIGQISFAGKDIAGVQMLWRMKDFDAAAMQSLVELYKDKLASLQHAQALGQEAPDMAFSAAEEEKLKADIGQLLAGKPHIALEKFSVKTAHGEAAVSLAVDFNKPESFELPPSELAKQLIGQLDAKVSVDKAVIGDGVRVQAALTGETDEKAVDEQANMFTEMGSGMALATEMVALKGDKLETSLHYANNEVVFNDQKMSVEEFVMQVMSKAGGLGGGADDEQAAGDPPDEQSPDADTLDEEAPEEMPQEATEEQ
ncbi:uncharacterized protein YdgA (DUF945 family) [Pseudomonas sp. TE3786]